MYLRLNGCPVNSCLLLVAVSYCEEGMFPFVLAVMYSTVCCFVSPIVICPWVIGPVVWFSCLLYTIGLVCPIVTVRENAGMLDGARD